MGQNEIIKASLFTPGFDGNWGLPLLIEGPPGTGKSFSVKRVVRACGLYEKTFSASLYGPEDVNGIPFGDMEQKVARMFCGAWVKALRDAGRAVLFIDEFNTAQPATQAAFLRLVLERVAGEEHMGAGVRIIAAQNATAAAANGMDNSKATANRFGHWRWPDPTARSLGDYLLGSGRAPLEPIDAAKEEARVMALWPTLEAKANATVASFLACKPDLVLQEPKDGDPQASKAWASPRSWEFAARALAGAEAHDLNEVDKDEFFTAFIGPGPAKEFRVWSRALDLPDPADVLDGRVKFEHDPARLDRTLTVLSSCAAFVTPKDAPKRVERAKMLWGMIAKVMHEQQDIVVPAARALVQASPSLVRNIKESSAVLSKLAPVFKAAGLLAQ